MATGPNGKGEREGSEGRRVNYNQAAQHVRSWSRSTRCRLGMEALLTIPSWASGSGREKERERENEEGPQCHPSRSSAKANKCQPSQRGDFRLQPPNTSVGSVRLRVRSRGGAVAAVSLTDTVVA